MIGWVAIPWVLYGVYPERKMRFFASLRMTLNEGFAMTPREHQLIYGVHYNFIG